MGVIDAKTANKYNCVLLNSLAGCILHSKGKRRKGEKAGSFKDKLPLVLASLRAMIANYLLFK